MQERGFKTYVYADDVAVLGIGDSFVRSASWVIEEWAEKHRIKINKSKCGVLTLRSKKSRKSIDDKKIWGYPVVRVYKYLGVEIDERLSAEKRL